VTTGLDEWKRLREVLAVAEAERKPVRERNRLHDAVGLAAAAVAAQPELHPAIVELCSDHNDLHDRVAAALVREHWDPVGAAATFLAVAEASGHRLIRPLSMHAALEVSSPAAARIAALCLLNIDAGRGNVSAKPTAVHVTPPVASNLELDAAQRVANLEANGGLEHAYHVAGPDFRPAAAALRSGASSGASATPSTPTCRPTPAGPRRWSGLRAREGTRGTALSPARPAHTPKTGSSAKPLPDPTPPYDP
jgi:hypothetical protein